MTGINLSEAEFQSDIKTENCPMSKCTTLKYGGGKPKSCVNNLLNYWKTCQAFSSLLQTTNICLYAEYMAIKNNSKH